MRGMRQLAAPVVLLFVLLLTLPASAQRSGSLATWKKRVLDLFK